MNQNLLIVDSLLLYTCITGQYDQLHEFETPFRKICFTDRLIFSSTWEIKVIDPESKIFRKVKIMPHLFLPEHERSVWIDGHLVPNNLPLLNRSGYWVMKHPTRTCIYQEAQECITLHKDNPATINEQMERYRLDGYPANNGLCATGVLIRDNTEVNRAFGEFWWHQVRTGSVRDQLSFNYCAWKTGLQFEQFPFLQDVTKWKHAKGRFRQRQRIRR